MSLPLRPLKPVFGRAGRLGCVLLVAALAIGCATSGPGAQRAVIRAKARVAPALVHVRPVKKVFSRGKGREVVTVGSGFIISPDGYVVTNEHVAGESTLVDCVLSSKEEVEAKVVGVDPYTDIAVLKLDVDHALPYVALGDSDALTAGQMVLALGSPHGLARSVSLGIVSVTDRYLEGHGTRVSPYNNWIQTDAAINPGNSGGPLVNLRGEVVGVNSRMLSGAENVGFAIPINVAKEVIDAIITQGRMRRSWLGLALQEALAKTGDPEHAGVLIADVDPLSPSHDAGIQPGDLLVAINGRPINARFEEDLPAVRKSIADLPVGKETTLTVRRGKELLGITVVTEEKSELKGDEAEFEAWGFTASALTPAVVRAAQLPSRRGILISGVQVGGIASNARLQQGDIVLETDEEAVNDLAHFRQIHQRLLDTKQRLTLLVVKRGALTRFVLIKQDGEPEATGGEEGGGDAE